MIRREPTGAQSQTRLWIRRDDLNLAAQDPDRVARALAVGRYHQRHPEETGQPSDELHTAAEAAQIVLNWTTDAVIAGLHPGFDTDSLLHLIAIHGLLPTHRDVPWIYQPHDIATQIGGLYGVDVTDRHTYTTTALSHLVGVDPADFDAHCALEDCRWELSMYDAATRIATTCEHLDTLPAGIG